MTIVFQPRAYLRYMKLSVRQLKNVIKNAVLEGTLDVHPLSIKPGDVINGRQVASVAADPKNKEHLIVTYDDGSTVRLRTRNLMNKHLPRIERPGFESDTNLQKIPAGWGRKSW